MAVNVPQSIQLKTHQLMEMLGAGGESSERLLPSLWLALTSMGLNASAYGPHRAEAMIQFLNENPSVLIQAKDHFSKGLLAEEHLAWILDDERQIRWVRQELARRFESPVVLQDHPTLTGRRLVIAFIDYRILELNQKLIQLSLMKSAWLAKLASDRRFSWFEKYESERCELFWGALKKQYPYTVSYTPTFNTLQQLLISIDGATLTELQIDRLIRQVKNLWAQQRYRQRLTDKRQVNLVLPNTALELLDRLSGEYDLPRTKILEILILDEAKKKLYLSERLKNRQALTLGT